MFRVSLFFFLRLYFCRATCIPSWSAGITYKGARKCLCLVSPFFRKEADGKRRERREIGRSEYFFLRTSKQFPFFPPPFLACKWIFKSWVNHCKWIFLFTLHNDSSQRELATTTQVTLYIKLRLSEEGRADDDSATCYSFRRGPSERSSSSVWEVLANCFLSLTAHFVSEAVCLVVVNGFTSGLSCVSVVRRVSSFLAVGRLACLLRAYLFLQSPLDCFPACRLADSSIS